MLGAEECVAAAALGIAGLLFLLIEATLRANEFLHRFSAEIQNELFKTLRKAFIIKGVLHLLGGLELRLLLDLRFLHDDGVFLKLVRLLLRGGMARGRLPHTCLGLG